MGAWEEDLLPFLAFLIVTFSNLIDSKGRIEGEMGDLSVKISRDLRREGSSKEGVVKGLPGEAI